jgi:hypothetical protein
MSKLLRDTKGRIVKGQKLNPKGRPVGKTISEYLRLISEEIEPNQTITKGEALARLVYKKALDGDKQCIELIYDRVDGKPKQSVDIKNDVPEEIIVTVQQEYEHKE